MTNSLAFNLLIALWIISELSVFRRDSQEGTGKQRDVASRLALLAAVGVGVVLSMNALLRGWMPMRGGGLLWAALGAAVLIGGILYRARAVRTLGQYFRTRVTILDDHRLITVGPYARLRHPSYTGFILCCLGIGLASGSAVGLAAMTVLPALALVYRIQVEERALAQAFGAEWTAYAARTHALIPGLW